MESEFLVMFECKKYSLYVLKYILVAGIICGIIASDIETIYAATSDDSKEVSYEVEVGKYGMTPIYGRDIADGTYDISVDSNSVFFKVVHGSIVVNGDDIIGTIEIGSHSYLHCFPGIKEEADLAAENLYIEPVEYGDSYLFTFPVEALNKPIDCAAYSRKKKKWYDRKILFDAASLPAEALKIELPDYDAIASGLKALAAINGENKSEDSPIAYGGANGDAYVKSDAIEVPYEDGEYSIEVSMAGGTGRVTISSPTLMMVKDGKAYAKILMSSSHYDWMIAGGEKYYNENTDGGNSYFIIPITAMDSLINVIANTTAMDEPVAIEYTLTFYADTIGNKGQIPQEAAKKVIFAAIAIIAAGAVLDHFVKKKRRVR